MDAIGVQWLMIALGLASAVAMTVWLLHVGLWWLIVALVAVTAHAGYAAWREGLPLLPGHPARARA